MTHNRTRPTRRRGYKPPAEKGVPCEVYSRIVGYLRPVQNWNDGKRQEFKDRLVYRMEPVT